MKLSKKIKLELYNLLSKEPYAYGETDSEGIIPFLSDIWDLALMKSEDKRYTNALGDFVQHLINNDDYSYDYVFQERLKLLEDDEKFPKFIETIVSPKYRKGEDDIFKFILLINPYLEREGYTLFLSDYDENGDPIYKLGTSAKGNIPNDIKPNDIIFYVAKSLTGRNDKANSHNRPPTYPSFVLAFNSGWNDFSIRSSFCLFYYEKKDEPPINIGGNKIIYNNEESTIQFMPDKFTSLDENFCSLGQEDEYYTNMKETLGKNFYSILYALRDAAFFHDIQDSFQGNSTFRNPLIRFDDAERLLREAPYKIYGYDLSNLYSFKYCFQPVYSTSSIDIEFDFNTNTLVPNRIYALIGKNGTGKTQLITSLPIKKTILLSLKPLYLAKLLQYHIVYLIDSRFRRKPALLTIIIVALEKKTTNNFPKKNWQ